MDDLVVKENQEVIPGCENINTSLDSFSLPMLVMMQQRSKQVDDKLAAPGDIINKKTNDKINGKTFIVIGVTEYWARFNPQNTRHPDFVKGYNPGALIWKSFDKNDPRVISEGRWRGDDNRTPPVAVKNYGFVLYFPEDDSFAGIAINRTSTQTAKDLLQELLTSRNKQIALKKFSLDTVLSKKYGVYTFVLKKIGINTPEDMTYYNELVKNFAPLVNKAFTGSQEKHTDIKKEEEVNPFEG